MSNILSVYPTTKQHNKQLLQYIQAQYIFILEHEHDIKDIQ